MFDKKLTVNMSKWRCDDKLAKAVDREVKRNKTTYASFMREVVADYIERVKK